MYSGGLPDYFQASKKRLLGTYICQTFITQALRLPVTYLPVSFSTYSWKQHGFTICEDSIDAIEIFLVIDSVKYIEHQNSHSYENGLNI